jgi:hypothetical protein
MKLEQVMCGAPRNCLSKLQQVSQGPARSSDAVGVARIETASPAALSLASSIPLNPELYGGLKKLYSGPMKGLASSSQNERTIPSRVWSHSKFEHSIPCPQMVVAGAHRHQRHLRDVLGSVQAGRAHKETPAHACWTRGSEAPAGAQWPLEFFYLSILR